MIPLGDLRTVLQIEDDEHDLDEWIERTLEPAAVATVQNFTGYNFGAAGSVVEYLTGNGLSELFLTSNPTADPTEILERALVGDVGTTITGAQSDGWVRRGNRLLRKAGGLWTWGYEYQVTYPGGYATGSEPAEIRQAVIDIVAISYTMRGTEGFQSESGVGGYSYSKAPRAIQDILDRLPRRGVFA